MEQFPLGEIDGVLPQLDAMVPFYMMTTIPVVWSKCPYIGEVDTGFELTRGPRSPHNKGTHKWKPGRKKRV